MSLNCAKRPETFLSLINDQRLVDWDIITIQEPPYNIETRIGFKSPQWIPIYPKRTSSQAEENIRSLILVRSSIVSDSYSPIHIPSLDITGLRIQLTDNFPLFIFNVYNPPSSNSSLNTLRPILAVLSPETQVLLIGDFNKHDPLWSGTSNPARNRRAASSQGGESATLLELLAEHSLELCLPPGTITFTSDAHKTHSTLDLVFASEDVADLVTKCSTAFGHGSDHLAVTVELDLNLAKSANNPRPQFRDTDWDTFRVKLNQYLVTNPLSPSITSREDIDSQVHHITVAMQTILKEVVPIRKHSIYAKKWWTHELTKMRKQFLKTDRLAHKPNATIKQIDDAHSFRKEYHKAIRHQKSFHWKNWVEHTDERSIWLANKYTKASSDTGASSRLPTLAGPNGPAESNSDKCQLLLNTFFPPPPPAVLDDIEDYEYPEELEMEDLALHEVEAAIANLNPYKAPGPSGIPNAAIKAASSLLAPILTRISNACLRLSYFPKSWRIFSTITLRKPQKDDYTAAKAYRPIALEETLGKVLESVIARRLSSYAERSHLLPPNHFGGRPMRTTTDAVLLLTQRIKDAWRGHKVASALFLDISQAFPTVSHERLLHNLRKRRIPTSIINLLRCFLQERYTTLSFDDFTSDPVLASFGIPQGSPLSPILYLFYSSDLLEIMDPKLRDRFVEGFIDDTIVVVISPTIEENVQKMEALSPTLLQTAHRHSSQFDLKKFQLVHFTRRKDSDESLSVVIGGVRVNPSKQAKYLGIILDNTLRWKPQLELVVAKATAAVLAINRLCRPTFGMPHRYIRQIYKAVVLPRIEYGLIVWYTPLQRMNGRTQGSVAATRRLQRIQRLAASIIAGGFKSTATDTLEYHAHLEPLEISLSRTIFGSAARIATLPASHPLHKLSLSCSKRSPRFHKTPLHILHRRYPILSHIETTTPMPHTSTWSPDLTFSIAPSKKQAIKDLDNYKDSVCIYTDGSGYKGKVGAAAIVTKDGQLQQRRKQLGTLDEHTVFEGEAVGTILGLDLISSFPRARKFTILLDNQAAIRAIKNGRKQPGEYLISTFHDELKRLQKRRKHLHLHLAWIPGHMDVPGNELADVSAKEAAQGSNDPLKRSIKIFTRPLPISVSAAKAANSKELKEARVGMWNASPRAKFLSRFDKRPPNSQLQKIYGSIPRRAASLLTQLRTGHIGLNYFLHKIRQVDSPLCATCGVDETVDHYLLHCRRFTDARLQFRRHIKGPFTLTRLIGVKIPTKHLFTFTNATGRFPQYHTDI